MKVSRGWITLALCILCAALAFLLGGWYEKSSKTKISLARGLPEAEQQWVFGQGWSERQVKELKLLNSLAQEVWESEPRLGSFFTEEGIIVLDRNSKGDKVPVLLSPEKEPLSQFLDLLDAGIDSVLAEDWEGIEDQFEAQLARANAEKEGLKKKIALIEALETYLKLNFSQEELVKMEWLERCRHRRSVLTMGHTAAAVKPMFVRNAQKAFRFVESLPEDASEKEFANAAFELYWQAYILEEPVVPLEFFEAFRDAGFEDVNMQELGEAAAGILQYFGAE